jgi:hypothetical protein
MTQLLSVLLWAASGAPVGAADAIPPHRPLELAGLHAYAEKSVTPGQTMHFRVSSTVPYVLSICRLGPKIDDPAGDEVLHTFPSSPPVRQPIHPGSYVHVAKSLPADRPLTALSLECWVRLFRADAWQTLLAQHDYPEACGFGLGVEPQGHVGFYLGDGAKYRTEWSHRGPQLDALRWHHVVGTWDGQTKTLWLDGELVGEWPHAVKAAAGAGPLRLGACAAKGQACNFLDGDLALPAIYDRALSAAEIRERYSQQGLKLPGTAGLVACWPLDEERGTCVRELSSAARHGRIINEGTWMIGGPSFDARRVPHYGSYEPAQDPRRGHALRLAADDLYDCRWQTTHEYTLPKTARPGLYVGRFRYELDGQPRLYHATFVVKQADDRPQAPLLVLAAANTWLAYNGTPFAITPPELHQNWGCGTFANSPGNPPIACCYVDHHAGQPTYHMGLEMPWRSADPYVLYCAPGVFYSHLMRAERFALVWLEQSGYAYDVVPDFELDRHPEVLAGYKAVVVNGHSEYWSFPEMEALDRYLRGGGNLIVLSGNTMCWRVSFNPEGTIMECRKYQGVPGGRRHAATGELWHSQDGRRGSLLRQCGWPSWRLIGLDSLGFSGTAAGQFGPYRVEQPDHFLFHKPEEVGLAPGDTFGAAPDGGVPRAVGHEWDVRLPLLAGITRNPPPGVTIPDEPTGILTLASGLCPTPTAFDYYFRPVKLPDNVVAHLIYWERPEGGRVFNAGSIGAGWGLSADPKLQTLLRNVLHHCGVPRPANPAPSR